MAVAYQTKFESFNADTTSPVTGTEPTGTAQNDFLFALFAVGAAATAVALPALWTPLRGPALVGSAFRYVVGYIVRGAAAPSLDFTWAGASGIYNELQVLRFSGNDTVSPIEATSAGAVSGTGATTNPPAATAVNVGGMAVAWAIQWQGLGSAGGAPAGYTMRSRASLGDDSIIATKAIAATGAEDPAAMGTWGASNSFVTDTFIIAPAGGVAATRPRQSRRARVPGGRRAGAVFG